MRSGNACRFPDGSQSWPVIVPVPRVARAWRRAVVCATLLLVPRPVPASSGQSLTAGAIQQIRDYARLREGDEWAEAELRVLTALCAEQDQRVDEVRAALAAARAARGDADREVVDGIARRFESLAENEALILQDVALWQIRERKRFDPNFIHNLAARSALTAYRLERKARIDPIAVLSAGASRAPREVDEFDRAFRDLLAKLESIRQDPLSADPSIPDPVRSRELVASTAAERERVSGDAGVIAFPLGSLERFRSFFEIVRSIYPDDWSSKRGFGDVYELTQFLGAVELKGATPNASYAIGPFNLSPLTEELTRPNATQPVTLVSSAYFVDAAAPRSDEAERDPLRFLAKHSRRAFGERELPAGTWALYRYLRAAPGKGGANTTVSQQVYENRLFVLTGMSDQGFFERYRSVRNDRLFFEQAEAKLSIDDLKQLLRQPYAVPGGAFVLPRFELLEYTRSQLDAETSVRRVLERIPEKVHIDFIRPVILAIFDRLSAAERDAIAKQRVRDIASHFGSPAGVVGNADLLRQYLALFRGDVQAGAQALAASAGISELTATKWLVILLAIESRGNLFAVSPTGAIGPFQHTYYFYLKIEPASIPFDPRKSAIKTGKELGRLYASYAAAGSEEALDLAVAAYNQGPAAVAKARESASWREAIAPEGRRYVESVRRHLNRLGAAQGYDDVARTLVSGFESP